MIIEAKHLLQKIEESPSKKTWVKKDISCKYIKEIIISTDLSPFEEYGNILNTVNRKKNHSGKHLESLYIKLFYEII